MIAKRKTSQLAGALSRFVRQHMRKAQPNEPNAERYDRKFEERKMRRFPSETSNLLANGAEGPIDPIRNAGDERI
ncbi:hypothetical protein [Paraburkholderia sp. MM5384-R2]|uniref:hypothetical protein n=1 Tax=Paraburkholderia sp. MM5384-R2 TaxID=2723097 RepID=UPI00160F180D|nr:hypothetical protein [Paraburkholderia sp. MM5384-R2]MBB5497143.1 uncharacterized short protein YbdD (DUF466 family) [Paraburkholderia sp. MM5384-R2]